MCVRVKSGQRQWLFLESSSTWICLVPGFSLLLLFSCQVMSDSLRSHGLQHSRLPCPSPSLGVCPRASVESEMPFNHLILCQFLSGAWLLKLHYPQPGRDHVSLLFRVRTGNISQMQGRIDFLCKTKPQAPCES